MVLTPIGFFNLEDKKFVFNYGDLLTWEGLLFLLFLEKDEHDASQ